MKLYNDIMELERKGVAMPPALSSTIIQTEEEKYRPNVTANLVKQMGQV